jgi:hypothetical protein
MNRCHPLYHHKDFIMQVGHSKRRYKQLCLTKTIFFDRLMSFSLLMEVTIVMNSSVTVSQLKVESE